MVFPSCTLADNNRFKDFTVRARNSTLTVVHFNGANVPFAGSKHSSFSPRSPSSRFIDQFAGTRLWFLTVIHLSSIFPSRTKP